MTLAAATVLTIVSTASFFVLERVRPGRTLPNAPGWYGRALAINLCQIGLTLAGNKVWNRAFANQPSLVHLSVLDAPLLEGLAGWLVGTFFFYWWHRIRHANGFWQVFHQVHHSPSRIEVLTSFYKHPVEIASNTVLSASILYGLLGVSLSGAYWFNFFAATAEYFYHANFRSPHWLRYFIQTPELHSIHHQLDVHNYNFSDLPLWDRLFGTYKDTTSFAPACGFPRQNERYLGRMLVFRDVYEAA